MESIAIWSACCSKIPLHNARTNFVLLSGLLHGENIMLKIAYFEPYVLILPDQSFFPNGQCDDNYLQSMARNFNELNKTYITRVETVVSTPVIGFTNNRKDVLLRLYVASDLSRRHLNKVLKTQKSLYEIPIKCVLHSKTSSFLQFLYAKTIKLQSWCLFTPLQRLPEHVADIPIYEVGYLNDIDVDEKNSEKPVHLRTISLRILANSSLSTRCSRLASKAKMPEDYIMYLAYKIEDEDPVVLNIQDFISSEVSLSTNNHDHHTLSLADFIQAESELLDYFGSVLHKANVQVIVYAADQPLVPSSCLEYVATRVNVINSFFSNSDNRCKFSFSPIRELPYECISFNKNTTTTSSTTSTTTTTPTANNNNDNDSSDTYARSAMNSSIETTTNAETTNNLGFSDMSHPGLERIEVCSLVKLMKPKPELEGFTLLDIIRHVNLLKKNPIYNKHQDLNFIQPSQFSLAEDIVHALKVETIALRAVVSETSFLATNIAVSKQTDLEIKQVVERGQQRRVFGSFSRYFHDYGLYLNHEDLKRNSFMIERPNSESSFPDPEWLCNPNVDTFKMEAQIAKKSSLKTSLPTEEKNQVDNQEKQKEEEEKQKYLQEWLKKKRKSQSTSSAGGGGSKQLSKLQQRQKGKAKKEVTTYRGGLVLDPLAGFYADVGQTVITLDWKALYPNIIITWLICTMCLILDNRWYEDPKAKKLYVSRNSTKCDVFVTHYLDESTGTMVPVRTFLPQVVKGFLDARERYRELAKRAVDDREKINHQTSELSCKQSANSVYGFFGSTTSNIPCIPIANWITTVGQNMTQHVRKKVIETKVSDNNVKICGAVVGGDTDSVFTMWNVTEACAHLESHAEIRKFIYKKASEVAIECSKKFAPCVLVVENEYSLYWLLDKMKTYAGKKTKGEIVIKGMTTIKRDKCEMARKIGMKVVSKIIEQRGVIQLTEYKQWLIKELRENISWNYITDANVLGPFVLSTELNTVYKNKDASAAITLATQMQTETGVQAKPGDRLRYVIPFVTDCSLLRQQRILYPALFLKGQKKRLDVSAYMKKQVWSVLKQMLCLPIHQEIYKQSELCINQMESMWKSFINTQNQQEIIRRQQHQISQKRKQIK